MYNEIPIDLIDEMQALKDNLKVIPIENVDTMLTNLSSEEKRCAA
ncbi:hypothetical protein [Enterocloster citroniae]|uniref:Uncharacterized protein n=1 Tax=[Clostridium] citroniae WAL-17108 TaxID=742733 RepID=G5HE74_9FIRM|nr:hypothetical protein [Enterocloster citroniae]EHF00301.1 hypothetical protein HMPREF9469_00886 [ [[Clostridium] citroniae WAL-17108]